MTEEQMRQIVRDEVRVALFDAELVDTLTDRLRAHLLRADRRNGSLPLSGVHADVNRIEQELIPAPPTR